MKPLAALLIITLTSILTIAACSSDEIGNSKDVNPETVYINYLIIYQQNDDSVDCLLQYRFAGENGTTLVLNPPSKVTIDGKEISVDSATFSGAYYEKKFAVEHFNGEHVIVFTDVNGKPHQENFKYSHIICNTKVPDVINRNQLNLTFTGALEDDSIDVQIKDTSEVTDDLHIVQKPVNNSIAILAKQLKNLSSGPLTIEISYQKTTTLAQPTLQGGALTLIYEIAHIETVLKDDAYSLHTSE